MKVIQSEIEGVLIIEPKLFGDARGYFSETFSEREFCTRVFNTHFVQDSESKSSYGVVRGLHFQRPPHTQAKLVRVVSGRVIDIAVDIRHGSPTFGRYVAVELSGENHRQVFIPRGFAHGFAVLSEEAVFQYKSDNYYAPESEGAIAWNDSSIGVDWQIPMEKIVLSAKDSNNPMLDELPRIFDYNDRPY